MRTLQFTNEQYLNHVENPLGGRLLLSQGAFLAFQCVRAGRIDLHASSFACGATAEECQAMPWLHALAYLVWYLDNPEKEQRQAERIAELVEDWMKS
jgi:hypothetical protein